jgi:hypothetical protein
MEYMVNRKEIQEDKKKRALIKKVRVVEALSLF